MSRTNPIYLRKPPKHSPGEDTVAYKRAILVEKAAQIDAGDLAGDATTQLFDIPANTLVHEVVARITAAWGGSQTFTLGDGVDPDRFMDNTIFAPNTVGMKSSKQDDSQPGAGGFLYTSADTIDLVGTGTPSAGTLDVYLYYTMFADEEQLA